MVRCQIFRISDCAHSYAAGCMIHSYTSSDAENCFGPHGAVFIGDSVTRKLFFQFANILDPKLPSTAPDYDTKHADHLLRSSTGIELSFYWDPFLNSSHADAIISGIPLSRVNRPAVLVMGSGHWYLRYSATSGGLPAWENKIKDLLDAITRSHSVLAEQIFFLPVVDVVESKLSPERAATMLGSDCDAMNSDLYHRIHASDTSYFNYPSSEKPAIPVTLPTVFNAMLDPSQTDDGLHFSDVIMRMQANVLFNSHCNDRLPKTFPLDKTCCRSYPRPNILHAVVLTALVMWGPCTFLLARRYGW
jgi:N-acetylneuraminate 9-O-acetyltransferase